MITRMCRWVAVAGAGAVLVAIAPAVSAATTKHHLKLTAVVTGQKVETVKANGLGKTKVTVYSVSKGSRNVGSLTSVLLGCAGNTCPYTGSANLKVGKVKGRAKVSTTTRLTGCPPCSPPIPTGFKSNTGKIFNAKDGFEAIRVNGEWPKTKGSKVTLVLSY